MFNKLYASIVLRKSGVLIIMTSFALSVIIVILVPPFRGLVFLATPLYNWTGLATEPPPLLRASCLAPEDDVFALMANAVSVSVLVKTSAAFALSSNAVSVHVLL